MLTEDYLLRQIAQATAVLARVLGLRKAGRHTEAKRLIDGAIEELLGFPPEMIDAMEDPGLLALLSGVQGVDCGKLFALADLLTARGDALTAGGLAEQGRFNYERAMLLYDEYSNCCPDKLVKEVSSRIRKLQRRLHGEGGAGSA